MKKRIIAQFLIIILLFCVLGCGSNKNENTDYFNSETTNLPSTETSNDAINENALTEGASDAGEGNGDAQSLETQNKEASINEETEENNKGCIDLDDGEYIVSFDTDNSMFHVNEAMKGKARLTVTNGSGVLHLIMPSKNILNLYCGLVEDAEKDESNWINPAIEEVTYEDGMTEEVFAYDVPIYVLDEEFDLALIGKKGVWYDHKVVASDPQPVTSDSEVSSNDGTDNSGDESKARSTVELSLEGGTGKVSLTSPTKIVATDEGYIVTLEWSSKNYDYMIVENVKYEPVKVDETSIFEIPIKSIDVPLEVIADTVAMSKPHEIEYTITFNADSLK